MGRGLALHRSNSSLELPHSPDPASRVPETPLRREYGSHGKFASSSRYLNQKENKIIHLPTKLKLKFSGSIDVVAQSGVMIGENLFAMLQDLRPSPASSTPDQRNSVGMEYLRRVPDGQSVDVDEVCGPTGNSSPKLRLKLHRLWGAKAAPRAMEESSCASPVVSADVEERHRRRAFAHYDCQSLTANLGYAAKLRGILLARRRNTATGASAASSFRASTPDETPEEDAGDGRGER